MTFSSRLRYCCSLYSCLLCTVAASGSYAGQKRCEKGNRWLSQNSCHMQLYAPVPALRDVAGFGSIKSEIPLLLASSSIEFHNNTLE